MKVVLEHIISNRYTHLLLALVALFLFAPLIHLFSEDCPVFTFLFLLLIVFTLRIMHLKKTLFLFLLGIASVAFALQWLNWGQESVSLEKPFALFVYISYAFLIGFSILFLIYKMLLEKRISADTVMGGISVYILIGVLWTFLYRLLYLFNTGAFDFGDTVYQIEENLFYFSFVSLTTLGYGDIVPLSPMARTLSMMEAILGQVYLTVFVAHLVGFYIGYKLKEK